MTDYILRLPQVKARTGLSRTTIYTAIARGTFPEPVALGRRAVGWTESSIAAWIESRPSSMALHSKAAQQEVQS